MRRKGILRSSSEGNLVFLLGHPISHSLSPGMQNAAFRHLGLPWLYVPLDLLGSQVKTFVDVMRDLPAKGANVTVPYKDEVLASLDGLDTVSKKLGSVNTIYRRNEKLWGTSTDGVGFLRSLGPFRRGLKGSRGLLLGAGGAGKAVAFALAESGVATLLIANRSVGSLRRLCRMLRSEYPGVAVVEVSLRDAEFEAARCNWVIQATSLGLKNGDRSPIPLHRIGRSSWALDLIYHRETSFMKEARAHGLRVMDGSEMLLHQGALSFEYWSGRRAPIEIMRRNLRAALSNKS
jgi:shikimate dehydrogenase